MFPQRRWSGDVNLTALQDVRALGRDPFTMLGKLKLVTDLFGRFGIRVCLLEHSLRVFAVAILRLPYHQRCASPCWLQGRAQVLVHGLAHETGRVNSSASTESCFVHKQVQPARSSFQLLSFRPETLETGDGTLTDKLAGTQLLTQHCRSTLQAARMDIACLNSRRSPTAETV